MAPAYQPATYWGKVTRQELSTTKNNNPQFILSFCIIGKIDPTKPDGDLIACPQMERSVYRVLTDKTIEYAIEDLKTLGYAEQSFKFLDPSVDNFHNFVGKEFPFTCAHKPDDKGQLKEEWSVHRQRSGPIGKPIEAKQVRDLDNLFGKHLKALGAKKSAPPAESPAREPIAGQGLGVPASQTAQALEHAAAVGEDGCPF